MRRQRNIYAIFSAAGDLCGHKIHTMVLCCVNFAYAGSGCDFSRTKKQKRAVRMLYPVYPGSFGMGNAPILQIRLRVRTE